MGTGFMSKLPRIFATVEGLNAAMKIVQQDPDAGWLFGWGSG
ncbi:hypothetical protein [Galactobacillus timonensis]|nr:hypothetical protein [Galactobacillus timonensis]